jgi:hypothetical protein
MSRACYTPFEECSNTEYRCKWVTRQEQQDLQLDLLKHGAENNGRLKEKLRLTSTYRCWSSLFLLDFGCNKNGQFLACTVDPMHMFEGGWIAMVCKAFVASLSSGHASKLNTWAIDHIKKNRSSFRKNFPRVDFSGGITKVTNIASHEWPGILLVYLIAVRCPSGYSLLQNHFDDNDSKFKKKVKIQQEKEEFNQNRRKTLAKSGLLTRGERLHPVSGVNLNALGVIESYVPGMEKTEENDQDQSYVMPQCTITNFIEMCESLLSFHAFYKQKKYWKKDDGRAVREFEKSLRAMMRIVVTTMDRGDNTYNWNIQKFHEILHLPKQVREYGNICNTDAGFGERGLKFWAKRHGRRALKGNTDVFTASTIKRVREHVCLRKAAYIVSSSTYSRKLSRDSSYHSNSSCASSDECTDDISDDDTSTGYDTDDNSSGSSLDSSSVNDTQNKKLFSPSSHGMCNRTVRRHGDI